MMKTLQLEIGDLVQIKSTDLPSGTFVKIEPQSTNFLDISDPKAVLEQAFRNFSCLTKGDIFSFHYNDTVYDVAVLEVKPESSKMGISVVEVDLSVDFAPPVGYVEPSRSVASGTSTPRSGRGLPAAGGLIHSQSTMAASINYNDIAPSSSTAAAGARAVSSNFLLGGQKLSARKGGKDKAPTPKPSTPVAGASSNSIAHTELSKVPRRTNGPQPLRLQPNQLFFGYEIKSVKTQADRDKENAETVQPRFEGVGQTLRGRVKRKGGEAEEKGEDKGKGKAAEDKAKGTGAEGRRLDGRKI
jgi:ubiquitin fusion degradation protein 1